MERKDKKKLQKHSKRVKRLRVFLPSMAFLFVALLFLWPYLFEQNDKFSLLSSSFMPVLRRSESSMKNARFYSSDRQKEPLMVTADEITQNKKNTKEVFLINPKADFIFSKKMWAHLSSPKGIADKDLKSVYFKDKVMGWSDNGYEMHTSGVRVLEKNKQIKGENPILIFGEKGRLEAEGFLFQGKTLTFENKTSTDVYIKETPLNIKSQKGLKINQEEKTAVYFGDVETKHGADTLNSQELHLFYRDGEKGIEFYRLLAKKEVVILHQNLTLEGKQAQYDFDEKCVKVFGSPAKATDKEDKLSAIHLDYFEKENKIVARRNVKLEHLNSVMTADEMTAFLSKNAKGENELTSVDVNDNIVIMTNQETISASKGHYDATKGLLTLTQDVVVKNSSGQVLADEVLMDLNTGLTTLKRKSSKG